MTSLKAAVYALYAENNNITLFDLQKTFDKAKPETLRRYLYEAQKYSTFPKKKKITSITLEKLEPIIAAKLEHNPTNQDLKLAVEIIKIKQQETALMDEIDLDAFLLRATEDEEEETS